MAYFSTSSISQPFGYDREDGSTTCRANRDLLLKAVNDNFLSQAHDYFLKNNTYDGITYKHEIIDITPEGEIQIFVKGNFNQVVKTNYSTNLLGKFCCETQFIQFIVPNIENTYTLNLLVKVILGYQVTLQRIGKKTHKHVE